MKTKKGPLSYAEDIRPLFRDSDVTAMIRFGGFDLSKYEDVSEHAESIHERLMDKTMPCDGPWPDTDIEKFKQWIDDGKHP